MPVGTSWDGIDICGDGWGRGQMHAGTVGDGDNT